MKKTSLLILAATITLAASSMTLAETVGSVPRCNSGPVDIEIYNKSLDDCAPDGKSEYCIYGLELNSNDYSKSCIDDTMELDKNLNESYALTNPKLRLKISHYLYTKGGSGKADLHFDYSNGKFTNNCAEVFGSDVSCVTTVSGPANHRLYKVTISRNG